jgi:hypothetical protein
MEKVQGLAVGKILLAGLGISLIAAGIAQAQSDLPAFTGKFTLTTQVHWDKTILQPGDHTITLGSSSMPSFALVTDSKGRPVARFVSLVDGGDARVRNALLIGEQNGQLRVYSLALGSLGRVLVYDPALAREAVLQARAPRNLTVMLAKR